MLCGIWHDQLEIHILILLINHYKWVKKIICFQSWIFFERYFWLKIEIENWKKYKFNIATM